MSVFQSVRSCTRCYAKWRSTFASRKTVSTVWTSGHGLPLGLLQPAGGPLIAAQRACQWSISGLDLAMWPSFLRRLSWMIDWLRGILLRKSETKLLQQRNSCHVLWCFNLYFFQKTRNYKITYFAGSLWPVSKAFVTHLWVATHSFKKHWIGRLVALGLFLLCLQVMLLNFETSLCCGNFVMAIITSFYFIFFKVCKKTINN